MTSFFFSWLSDNAFPGAQAQRRTAAGKAPERPTNEAGGKARRNFFPVWPLPHAASALNT